MAEPTSADEEWLTSGRSQESLHQELVPSVEQRIAKLEKKVDHLTDLVECFVFMLAGVWPNKLPVEKPVPEK